jgi:glycosyltransferase involved in cell wall biosynthesis
MELKTKKTVLILVDWYLPGYKAGGPIKSVSSIVNYFKNDFNFLIITSDTDFGEYKSYESIKSDEWIKFDDSLSIFYASKRFLSIKNLYKLIKSTSFDLMYLNSFFSFKFSLLPLVFKKIGCFHTPILLAPRGMLGEGALKLKSTKKRLFIRLSKVFSLHKNVFWHATSTQEKKEIELVFGNTVFIYEVPNLQYNEKKSADLDSTYKEQNVLKLFFFSRISEKKNLHFALEVLKKMNLNEGLIEFYIIGPIEDELYWNKCKSVINLLSPRIKVFYLGAIKNDEVPDVIAPFHFLFLPTFNENYGHAIVESFLSGKPVIISDQTPWRDLQNNFAGWDIPLEANQFVSVLNSCLKMTDEHYSELSRAAVAYALKNCISSDSVDKTKLMFLTTLKNG